MSLWRDPTKRRWLIWSVLAIGFLLVNVHRLSTAVLAGPLMASFDATGAELGVLHAAFFAVYAAMQLPSGILVDGLGSRRIATLGITVMSIGSLVLAASELYVLAVVARAVIGLGASVVFLSILRFGANWFRPNEFATVHGLTISVAGLGGVIASTPLALFVEATGWQSAMVALAAAGFVVAFIVLTVTAETPREAGLAPIAGVPHADRTALPVLRQNVKSVLGDLDTWLLGTVVFCGTGSTITLIGLWGIPFVTNAYGISVVDASVFTLLGSIGLIVGPPLVGWVSDRLDRRLPLMLLGSIAFTAGFGLLAVWRAPPLIVVGIVYFGLSFLVGASALSNVLAKEGHPPSASGTATGSVNAAAFTGAALFPPVMGLVLDVYWTGETLAGARVYTVTGYRVAFGIAALAGVVSFVAVLWLRHRAKGAIRAD